MIRCPECNSQDVVKAGERTWYRKHKEPHLKTKKAYLCRGCGLTTVKPVRARNAKKD